METDSADLEIKDGNVMPKGVPARTLPLAQLARQAILAPFTLPPNVDRVLETHENFVGDGITGSGWSGGTHACTVEVDLESGQVKILRYVVVEDCGRVINPAIVEGQVCGAVAQAVGEVFLERAVYDDGNFLAATFMDYLLPTAAEVPSIEIDHLETDPDGEFGSRGVGEGGLIVGPAALTNAVADALAPCGVRILEQYLPPDRVLELAGVIPMSDAD
jgi:carbon-monoxide dehydrogenase large subunit